MFRAREAEGVVQMDQVNESAMLFLCEEIPDDVWTIIFRLVAHSRDIGDAYMSTAQVCLRWSKCFNDSINEATIFRNSSLKRLMSLSNLSTLVIKKHASIDLEIFENVFTRIHHLVLNHEEIVTSNVPSEKWSLLTNLKSLDLSQIESPEYHFRQGFVVREVFMIKDETLRSLTSLQTLKLGPYVDGITFESLSELVHLTNLNLRYDGSEYGSTFEHKYGDRLILLDSLKELKSLKLMKKRFVDCEELQLEQRYPLLNIRWYENEDIKWTTTGQTKRMKEALPISVESLYKDCESF
jgi:hypothetical protein